MDAHSVFAGKGRVGPDFFLCCLAGMEQSLSEDFLSFSDPLARKSRFWRGGPIFVCTGSYIQVAGFISSH